MIKDVAFDLDKDYRFTSFFKVLSQNDKKMYRVRIIFDEKYQSNLSTLFEKMKFGLFSGINSQIRIKNWWKEGSMKHYKIHKNHVYLAIGFQLDFQYTGGHPLVLKIVHQTTLVYQSFPFYVSSAPLQDQIYPLQEHAYHVNHRNESFKKESMFPILLQPDEFFDRTKGSTHHARLLESKFNTTTSVQHTNRISMQNSKEGSTSNTPHEVLQIQNFISTPNGTKNPISKTPTQVFTFPSQNKIPKSRFTIESPNPHLIKTNSLPLISTQLGPSALPELKVQQKKTIPLQPIQPISNKNEFYFPILPPHLLTFEDQLDYMMSHDEWTKDWSKMFSCGDKDEFLSEKEALEYIQSNPLPLPKNYLESLIKECKSQTCSKNQNHSPIQNPFQIR